MEDWEEYTAESTPAFSLEGLRTQGRVVGCYDGDTLTVAMRFRGVMNKFACRIQGIDTCEMKSKSTENRSSAIRARNRVLQLLGCPVELEQTLTKKEIQKMLHSHVVVVDIHCSKFDKYGRLLCDIYVSDGRSISEVLLSEKIAYSYDGKTKLTEDEQEVAIKFSDGC